jgi:hypothetical protein
MRNHITALALTFLIFCGCSTKQTSTPEVLQPAWINKPSLNGKIGAVGSSRPQFKGKTVQRRVAVSRALDELAQQSGVRVDSIVMRDEKSSGSSASSSTQVHSIQEAAGLTINAHIEEVWTNPTTKEIFVWLVAD